DVLDLDVVLTAEQVGDELVAVAGRAAVVRAEHGVAFGGQQRPAVNPVLEVVVGGRGWAAVDFDDQRQALAGLVIRRQFQDAFYGVAVRPFPGDRGQLGQLPGVHLRVYVRQAAGVAGRLDQENVGKAAGVAYHHRGRRAQDVVAERRRDHVAG